MVRGEVEKKMVEGGEVEVGGDIWRRYLLEGKRKERKRKKEKK